MAKIKQDFTAEEIRETPCTFHKDSTLLVDALSFAMPCGDSWSPDEDTIERTFLMSGMEQLLKIAFEGDANVVSQEPNEGDYGIWHCYFKYEGVTCRVTATHQASNEATLEVEATLDEWDTWGDGGIVTTPADLVEKTKLAVMEAAKAVAKKYEAMFELG